MASSKASGCDDEMRALQVLFEAFGTVCPMNKIASAYCEAGYDISKAGDMLYQLQESSISDVFNAQNENKLPQSEGPLDVDDSKSLTHMGKSSKGRKPKKQSVSVGTVSCVLGKKYVHETSSLWNGCSESTKPPKLEIMQAMRDGCDPESFVPISIQTSDSLSDTDIEEFLFSMLGDGFKLSRDMMLDVLGCCGYDLKKSLDELLILSSKTLDKGKGVDYDNLEVSTRKSSKTKNCSSKDTYPNCPSTVRNIQHPGTEQKNYDLPTEVLQSLFYVPDRQKIKKTRLEIGLNRTRVVGQKPVTKPLEDPVIPSTTEFSNIKQCLNDGLVAEQDDEYQNLRSAAKQHWVSMKQYYEAAVDAFTKGDSDKAKYHLERGKYHNQKAREADEKAAAILVEPRKVDTGDEITLDIQDLHSKEALDLLKRDLKSFSNIPTIKSLKLITGAEGEDRKKGKNRRLALKLLDNESIKWNEDEHNRGTIYVQLDQVDPEKLSFGEE